MARDHQLRCIACGAEAPRPAADFRCQGCGALLEVSLPSPPAGSAAAWPELWRQRRASLRLEDASGVWRFREMLPATAGIVSLREGNTPLYELPRCAGRLGMARLWAKHQGLNPTGSFKDTGMTVALSQARQAGFAWVACASTGNTSASMAAYAARAGLGALVLVPAGQIAWGKLAQALDYGAVTCQVRGDFDDCMRVLGEVLRRAPVGLVNSVNPYRVEGQKSAAFELLEQLDWQPPDHIILPGGNLANASALGKGLRELHERGLMARMPKIFIVQAAGASPLAAAWRANRGREVFPVHAETRATAIRIGNPASWPKAVRVLQETGGDCTAVSEAEIAIAKAEIGAEGIGCEPASAAALAGLKQWLARGSIRREESVVLILTGHLLKDAEYALEFHRGEMALDASAAEAARPWQHPPVEVAADAAAILAQLDRAVGR
ncbi:MAG: threonine synthase [Terriglobales bacterium]